MHHTCVNGFQAFHFFFTLIHFLWLNHKEKEATFYFFFFYFFFILKFKKKNFSFMTNKQGQHFSHHYQHLFTLFFSHLLQANCPMNVDGEHLCCEQVHEILNWRPFFSLHYNHGRLSECLLLLLLLLLLLMHTILVTFQFEVCYSYK